MWSRHERKAILRKVQAARDTGPAFDKGNLRTDQPAFELMVFAYSSFYNGLAEYIHELEDALRAAGIETDKMQQVRRRGA